MKKFIFILLLISFVFISDNVYAFDFSAPMTYHTEYDCGAGSGECITTTVWPEKEAGLTNGFYYSQTINQSTKGFVSWSWGNANLCNGQNLIVTGEIKAFNGSHLSNSGFITDVSAYMNDSTYPVKCSFANTSKTTANFTCSGKGGGIFRIVANYSGLLVRDFIGVSKIVNLTCEATTNDILNAQNQNANNIINNQNQNANNIINNQNSNANAIIGASGAHAQLQIDTANQNQAQTNQNLNNINNSLNDDSPVPDDSVSNKTNEWSSKLAGTGPVSNIVLMPITLLNGYIKGFNSICTPYNLGNLMGTDIVFPCINISNYIGVSLWNVIDILFSGFMIFSIGKKLVKIFNDFTNLRDNQMDELYGGGK